LGNPFPGVVSVVLVIYLFIFSNNKTGITNTYTFTALLICIFINFTVETIEAQFLKNYLYLFFMLCTISVRAQNWRTQADSLLNGYRHTTLPAQQTNLLTRASLLFLFHNPDTAMILCDDAERIAETSKNDTLRAMAYAAKSAVYVIKDNNPLTLEYALKGLNISEKKPLPPDIMASLYRKTGYVYRNQNNNTESIAAYRKSLTYSVQANNLHDVSATSSNLGQIFGRAKQYDSCLHYHRKALEIAKQQGFSDIVVRSYINIMNAYDDMAQYPRAFAALYEMEPWLNKDEVTPIVKGLAFTAIAGLDLRRGNTNRQLAARYLDSMQHLLAVTKPGTDNMVDFYLGKALYEFSVQHYDSASAALISYNTYKAKKDNEIIEGHAQELATKYETAKKETQIKSLDAQNRLRKRLLFVFGGSALIFSALLVMVWFQKRKIKKQEAKLGYLMKELHHRVKNNLQIVSSLLSIQQVKIEDETAQKALMEGQNRINAMSLVHKKLYQTDIVNSVNIKEYISELCEHLIHAYGYEPESFNLKLDIPVKELEPDTAIPLGLILNEVVTNAMKYAYEGVTNPALSVTLTTQEQRLLLSVADNGTRLNEAKWQRSRSFGKQLIQSLTGQLNGTMQLHCGNGTTFNFNFPYKTNKT
jgi:two-component system, sensor histidine kinase PdtaS